MNKRGNTERLNNLTMDMQPQRRELGLGPQQGGSEAHRLAHCTDPPQGQQASPSSGPSREQAEPLQQPITPQAIPPALDHSRERPRPLPGSSLSHLLSTPESWGLGAPTPVGTWGNRGTGDCPQLRRQTQAFCSPEQNALCLGPRIYSLPEAPQVGEGVGWG